MTQGTIYYYVSSEDSILYLVCERIVAEYNEQARRALDTSHDPVERIAPQCAQSRRSRLFLAPTKISSME